MLVMTINDYEKVYLQEHKKRMRQAALNGFLEGFCGFGLIDFWQTDDNKKKQEINEQEKSNKAAA